ncbi:glycosyltransferase family 4 protein [Terribacillus saccharophilus]|uniref:glycosyltransferase family 4 protein n=1 Tax=Terribacillus saccharophilus TaxID=361277 RepID=UPI00380919CC
MKKKTILVVGSSLKDKGGITTVMNNIKKSSISNEFNLDFIATYITGNIIKRALCYFFGIMKLFLKLFSKPSLVHIHMSYKGSFYRKSLIILLVRQFRIPIVLHVHGSTFKDFYFGLSKMKKRYCKYILNIPDKVLVLSKEWKRFFSTIVREDKIMTLYNGVFVSNEIEKYKHNDIPTLLFLGRLGKRKGVYDLLEALEDIDKTDYKFNCIIAGDGEVEEVKQLIENKDLKDCVRCTGWIDVHKINELLLESDILILPSYNEGLPMAILEAMEKGLSIISTNVGGIPELVTKDNGLLVNPGDISSLKIAIKDLVSKSERREELYYNNISKIREEYNLEDILMKLRNLYNSTINKEIGEIKNHENMLN